MVASLEGTRPLMLEVQALVSRTHFGFPKRMVTGLDANRALLLIAVLEKRLGLHLETEDVFVNIVGGVKIKEPAIDLGVALAIASAHRNQTLDPTRSGSAKSGSEAKSVPSEARPAPRRGRRSWDLNAPSFRRPTCERSRSGAPFH